MGVAGSGKSFIGERLAAELGWKFYEGDSLHPAENLRKMAAHFPLDDRDRGPWLERLRRHVEECLARGENAVIACSALKESYRKILRGDDPDVKVVYLKGSKELIRERIRRRQGHFFPADLLDSQFAALEEPADAITVDVALPVEEIVAAIAAGLGRERDT
ncbi:MAG: gluconokinase [Candidatus Binatota bacterium]|nr:gluconokinase [Candidatus Binatota bacterium]